MGLEIARCRYEISSDSELANKKELGRIPRPTKLLTFSQMLDSSTINRRAMVINVGHQKLAEVPYDRPTNTVMGNPFNDGFGLYIT